MKKMIFAVAFAVLAAGSAYASGMDTNTVAQAGFSSLTEQEKAEVIAVITSKASAAATAPKVTADNVDKWIDISAKLGKGLAATAKELGIAANEFAVSPLGRLATVLIIWNMMGAMMVHVFGGLLIWAVGFTGLHFIMQRAYPTDITYHPTDRDKFGRAVVLKVEKTELSQEGMLGALITHGIVLAAGLLAMFTF